jgi:hypothetical protein
MGDLVEPIGTEWKHERPHRQEDTDKPDQKAWNRIRKLFPSEGCGGLSNRQVSGKRKGDHVNVHVLDAYLWVITSPMKSGELTCALNTRLKQRDPGKANSSRVSQQNTSCWLLRSAQKRLMVQSTAG